MQSPRSGLCRADTSDFTLFIQLPRCAVRMETSLNQALHLWIKSAVIGIQPGPLRPRLVTTRPPDPVLFRILSKCQLDKLRQSVVIDFYLLRPDGHVPTFVMAHRSRCGLVIVAGHHEPLAWLRLFK